MQADLQLQWATEGHTTTQRQLCDVLSKDL